MSKEKISEQHEIASQIIDRWEHLHAELYEDAKTIANDCHAILRAHTKEVKYAPPIALAVRLQRGALGPKLLWVSYTRKKRSVEGGGTKRFTRELTGRKNGKYPTSIFKSFSPELRVLLVGIEDRAARLRARVTFWRQLLKDAARIEHEERIEQEERKRKP